MRTNISKIIVLSLFAAALVAMPALSRAEDTNAAGASCQTTQPKLKKLATLPFHGKVGIVDVSAQTLTVGKLTLQITPDTKITKDGQPAILADGVAGELVGGAYKKTDDGKLKAIKVNFGAKGEKKNQGASEQ